MCPLTDQCSSQGNIAEATRELGAPEPGVCLTPTPPSPSPPPPPPLSHPSQPCPASTDQYTELITEDSTVVLRLSHLTSFCFSFLSRCLSTLPSDTLLVVNITHTHTSLVSVCVYFLGIASLVETLFFFDYSLLSRGHFLFVVFVVTFGIRIRIRIELESD